MTRKLVINILFWKKGKLFTVKTLMLTLSNKMEVNPNRVVSNLLQYD